MSTLSSSADWLLRGSAVETFTVEPPLYCAYRNTWGRDSNRLSEAFDHNPFANHGDLHCGAPAICDAQGLFLGFLDDHSWEACRFAFDGHSRLRARIPAGQTLVVGRDGDASWRRYNRRVLDALGWTPPASLPPTALQIEYNTWVEQRRINPGRAATKVVSHDFVMAYLDRLVRLGMPPGRLTIGYGWLDIDHSRWQPSLTRFPDFQKTIARIREAGFSAGVALAPGYQLADHSAPSPIEQEAAWPPSAAEPDPLAPLIRLLDDAGVTAITIDLPGQARQQLQAACSRICSTIREIAPTILLELHQADLFFTPFADCVRISDIVCTQEYPWEAWSRAQYDLAYRCAPLRPINLGPVGGTDPGVNAASFLRHLDLQREACGHPSVSMLGDHWSRHISEELAAYLRQPRDRHRIISDFADVEGGD